MDLQTLVAVAQKSGASDLHLEPGLPPALRIRGTLRISGEPLTAKTLLELARALLDTDHWHQFLERRSADFSRTIQGIRCRINILHSARGVGFAIRLLAPFQATIDTLNLHPDLKKLVAKENGLVLVSGPTGSGKSSTLAGLIQEINLTEARHILTIESPIEYTFRPRKAYIRQREVGRDTPSFEQALLDSLREDPDVLMVGEMREPETMRLTLGAAETGHLVLGTLHSSSSGEALQRVVSAFPSEIQAGVAAQLADCLLAVICQRLQYRADLDMVVPQCEVLMATHAVRNFIRNRDFFKVISAIETGADHGMWSFQRYQKWLDSRTKWAYPESGEPPDSEPDETTASAPNFSVAAVPATKELSKLEAAVPSPIQPGTPGRIEIEPVEGEFGKILKRPGA